MKNIFIECVRNEYGDDIANKFEKCWKTIDTCSSIIAPLQIEILEKILQQEQDMESSVSLPFGVDTIPLKFNILKRKLL